MTEKTQSADRTDASSTNNKPLPDYRDAHRYYSTGRLDMAEEALQRLVDAGNADANVLNLLGVVLLAREGPSSRAGGYLESAAEYRPNDAGIQNNLGTYYWRRGRLADAASHFRRSISLQPTHAMAHFNLGNVLRQEGKFAAALEAYYRSLELDEKQPDVHNALGIIFKLQGRIDEAIAEHRRAVELAPHRAEFYANLGNALSGLGKVSREQVLEMYGKALELDPTRVEFHASLGGILQGFGDYDRATREFRKAIRLRPDSSLVLNNLGAVLFKQKKTDEALAVFQQALALEPDSPNFLFNVGRALYELKRYSESAEYFQKVISVRPDWVEANINFGNSLYQQEKLSEARAVYERTMRLGSDAPDVPYALGLVAIRQGELPQGMYRLDTAISMRPDFAMARFARGMLFLKLGRFEEGWRDYEWRFEAIKFSYLTEVDWEKPEWEGAPFTGKTLLVYHEQGTGDAIHFARYLPMVKKLGGEVKFVCGPTLLRLFETLPGVDKLVSRRDTLSLEDVDFHVPLLSLPRIFGTELNTIPADIPYLRADPELVARWGKRIRQDGFKVGLVWEGNRDQGDNKHRSCALADYAPLAQVPGVVFYSLQVGPAAEQAARPPAGMELVDYTAELHDFAETAALIKNLDLVVTVDTSVAHLAGALGHPVWTVLWTNCCWRYLLERDDSPWYPTMRLYRQPRMGDWASVMQHLRRDLEPLVNAKVRS